MTPRIALAYFEGCPHVAEARSRLRDAMTTVGLEPVWEEWDTELDATPATYRRFGSPTILLDGRAISGGAEGSGIGCVVGGAPAVATIISALRRGGE